MSEDQKNNEEGEIYRVDTVPPPAGESDAYNAPTRVGAMAESVLIDEMIHAAESEAKSGNDTGAFAKPSTALIGKPATAPIQTPVASPSPLIPKAPAVPKKPPLPPPRPAAGREAPAPLPKVVTPPVRTQGANGSSPPAELPSTDMISAPPDAMPSFCDDVDEGDEDEYAPTLLHKNAKPIPPPQALPETQQAFAPVPVAPVAVAPVPVAPVPVAPVPVPVASVAPAAPAPAVVEAPSRAPRAPIPFDQNASVREEPAPVSLLPLVVGFGIFVVGLLLYLFVR